MIIVEAERCKGCGSCANICHEHCISIVDGRALVNHEFCSTCTQCIAICPEQALTWDHIMPVAYDEASLPSPRQLDELLKERRSIRHFSSRKIDRTVLEEIVGYGIYSPTNNYKLRAIVVDDESVIEALDRMILRVAGWIYDAFYKPRVVPAIARMLGLSRDYLLNKPKLENDLAHGHTNHRPAAVVFIAGDRRIALSETSAQYALCNMMFYAQVMGIGSCLWGKQMFLNRMRAARQCLGLRRHERIFGAVVLGYPAVKFRNKVEGKRMDIRWNGA